MVLVHYRRRILWGGARNAAEWLPYCGVQLYDTHFTRAVHLWALLDTGAQYVMLPRSLEAFLGVDLSRCSSTCVEVASGERLDLPYAKVNMSIRGTHASVWAIFGELETPLIGVDAMRSMMRFGVDDRGWLYRTKAQRPFASLLRWLRRSF